MGSAGLESVPVCACVCLSVHWIGKRGSAAEFMSFPGNTYILFHSEWKERLIAGHKEGGKGGVKSSQEPKVKQQVKSTSGPEPGRRKPHWEALAVP